jgi:hypothetical protein
VDETFAKAYATLSDTPLTRMELSEEEAKGEEIKNDEDLATVMRPRMILGNNIDDDVLVMNSSWSVCIKPSKNHEILQRLIETLPREIFPRPGDTIETVLERNNNCDWLDDIHRHGRVESANGARDCKQPCRRTVSISEGLMYRFKVLG